MEGEIPKIEFQLQYGYLDLKFILTHSSPAPIDNRFIGRENLITGAKPIVQLYWTLILHAKVSLILWTFCVTLGPKTQKSVKRVLGFRYETTLNHLVQ